MFGNFSTELCSLAINGLYLVVFGRQGAVAHHDTIHAESMEIGLVAKVTPIKHGIIGCGSKFFIFHF